MFQEPRKILVPTDFSDPAMAALPYAAGLAQGFDAELHLLHVDVLHEDLAAAGDFGAGWEGPPTELNRVLEALDRRTGDLLSSLADRARAEGIAVRGAQRRSVAAAPAIVEYAEEEGIDLIVMATHGRRGLGKLFLGSVAQEVVRHSSVPVLTVRGRDRIGEADSKVSILVGVDLSPASEALVEAGARFAKMTGGSLHLLHAIQMLRPTVVYEELPPLPEVSWERLEQEARERLSALARTTGLDPHRISIEEVRGAPADAILARCEGDDAADLVLLAHRQRSGIDRLFLGSVADRVINRCPVPVLTVPVGERAAGAHHEEVEHAEAADRELVGA